VHRRSNLSASIHTPSQAAHSINVVEPTSTCCSSFAHPGHLAPVLSPVARARRLPHFGQNAAVSNIRAKQEGQLTVASRA
jgi:hypothetical protein